MEGGERHSQSHSIEYDWLVPDLTRNTLVRYIPIFLLVLIHLTPGGPARSGGKQITFKIPLKMGGPLKEKKIIEDEKGKWVRTYSDVVSARKDTYRLSYRE